MIEIQNLSFSYSMREKKIPVLKNLDFSIQAGEFIGIQGPSGSGKSTLFYILGGLLKPTQGEMQFNGIKIFEIPEDERTRIRNRDIGFVFQQFHLLPNTSCMHNILLPTLYPCEHLPKDLESFQKIKYEKAKKLAHQLGLSPYLSYFPNQLSGGQQQRVAIARALIQDVEFLLADEPTGNLDSQTAQEIMHLLKDLHQQGKTIVLITHDSETAKYCSKIYHLRDGSFTHIQKCRNFQENPFSKAPPIPFNKETVFHSTPSENLFQRSFLARYMKIFKTSLPLVKENLIRNKAKSVFTILGVIIAVATVLAMTTLGAFAKKKILETYESLGVNKLIIRGAPNWNRSATDSVLLNFESFQWEGDLLPLKKLFPEIILLSPVLRMSQNNATFGGIRIENQVETFGVNTEYIWITNRSLMAGINITPYHIESSSPVCVIGYHIAKRFFSNTHAIGQILHITDLYRLSYYCRVIGVLDAHTSTNSASQPNFHILIPHTYFQSIAPNTWFREIHEAAIQVQSSTEVENIGLKTQAYFEQKYGKSATFHIDTESTALAQMKKFLNIFSALLTVISFLSLLVGGIGINNMILVSISERIKEFGLRKALGASNRSIRSQVLLESTSLCIVAGIIGLVLGFCAYEICIFIASQFLPHITFTWIFYPSAFCISFFSIILVGVLSGLIPALQAEKLDIIEALKTE